ncbi:MAG: hypothetical protein ACR2KB_13280 [Chitinophagaceae bacterium]
MTKIYLISSLVFLACSNSNSIKEDNKNEVSTHKVSSLLDSNALNYSNTIINNPFDTSTTASINISPTEAIIDSTLIKELKKSVFETNDEFSDITWVKPKTSPKYRNANGIYCYFGMRDNTPFTFRFVIQYYAEDWLFIKNYRFVIDGTPYRFSPENVQTDNGYGGKIWEWSDDRITSTDLELIKGLANAKTAKIRFDGTQYYKEKTITAKQLKDIKTIYQLYTSIGGSF